MIAIIGAGFAGLSALKENHNAVLIDRKDQFVMIPWIIDYACGSIDQSYVATKYLIHVKTSEIKVNFKDKEIITKDSKIKYDKLILSVGHHQNLPRLKGAKEYAKKIETLDDARVIRDMIPTSKSIVIVGGGATGVELAGNIKGNVTIIQRRGRLLPTMTTASSEKAKSLLEERGVNVMLKTEATEVKRDSVVTDKGEIKSDLTIFAGGLKGSYTVDELGLKNVNHRMIVEKDLSSVDYKDVYGAGDCATFQDQQIPMSAEVAMSSGRTAMRNAMGEGLSFRPSRLATILRIGENYFGDFGDSYVEGDEAKLMKKMAYIHSRLLSI
ncbi:NAD(P)/FAD-dependent oxidoreductase [Sulfuracidifex tepidarius]|uniref:Coenzyme A disulfide reductase n=1 Tax=Sulfuracidifex tepidarius TaxID=1294262 RepID=A0A510E5F1_9CREN|nr:FAD-dependent oxidoreductase [Sulfuracidifex tepidarius]BBG24935.1 Coenzyme A disulfide reductase [Sulfuracidifex tepidarius]BBG27719.1 Coenzyme A disulfide reductase [Sulfuracidifex tepidarius]